MTVIMNLQRFFIPVVLLLACSSCYYYKAASLPVSDVRQKGATLDSLQAVGRYLVLRNGSDAVFHIRIIEPGEDGAILGLQLDEIAEEHRYHLSAAERSSLRYRKANPAQNKVVGEVHVYIPYDEKAKPGSYALPLDQVQRIEVLGHDAKRTTNSHVLSGLGIAAAGLGIAILIVFLTLPFD